MSLDEDTLENVAQNGEMDYSQWPTIIEPLLRRLDHVVYHDFPLPRPYPNITPNVSTSSDSAQQSSAQGSTTLVSQTPTTPRTLPPVPPFPGSASSTSQIPNSQPEPSQLAQTSENDNGPTPELPLALAQLLASITATLRASFDTKPPHTIQRLAELILHPNNHYRTLPSYLRALDRVVSVSSTADIFPLSDQPALVNGVTNGELGGGILWKSDTNGPDKARDNELGSDESLGGALLTPIPWLREVSHSEKDELDSGSPRIVGLSDIPPMPDNRSASTLNTENAKSNPDQTSNSLATTALTTGHHDPLVPERQDGAVTQGELIRMEQEAGVVPVSHSCQSNSVPSAGRSEPVPHSIALGVGVGLDDLEDDDILDGAPHARGPDVVGTVDMGLVGGRDVQVHIGSPPDEGIRERGAPVNVNDAQDVLLGGSSISESIEKSKDSPSDDSYVDVGKEVEADETDVDAMQVDSDSISSSIENLKEQKDVNVTEEDEDIVLVDADGATEAERERIDEIGGQEGLDAGDTTR